MDLREWKEYIIGDKFCRLNKRQKRIDVDRKQIDLYSMSLSGLESMEYPHIKKFKIGFPMILRLEIILSGVSYEKSLYFI